jgi:large subunit ribosomal protein L25
MSLIIKAEKRHTGGKNAARRIRREGNVPAILYGPKVESIPLVLSKRDIFNILKSETGENTIFQVAFEKDKAEVMIKNHQKDVTSDEILHVDLFRISMDKEIRVTVPIVLTGDAVGVKAEGGFVEFATRELEVECLPRDIPEHIEVDIRGRDHGRGRTARGDKEGKSRGRGKGRSQGVECVGRRGAGQPRARVCPYAA